MNYYQFDTGSPTGLRALTQGTSEYSKAREIWNSGGVVLRKWEYTCTNGFKGLIILRFMARGPAPFFIESSLYHSDVDLDDSLWYNPGYLTSRTPSLEEVEELTRMHITEVKTNLNNVLQLS